MAHMVLRYCVGFSFVCSLYQAKHFDKWLYFTKPFAHFARSCYFSSSDLSQGLGAARGEGGRAEKRGQGIAKYETFAFSLSQLTYRVKKLTL